MTDQLSLFEVVKSEAPTDLGGHRKTCSTCKDTFFIPEGNHRAQSYCPTCRSKHNAIKYNLRLRNPLPDNHVCDCCGKSEEDLTIHYGRTGNPISPWRMDHCHETEEFRGWVCMNCNIGLGRFYDDVGLLEMAIKYIQKNRP